MCALVHVFVRALSPRAERAGRHHALVKCREHTQTHAHTNKTLRYVRQAQNQNSRRYNIEKKHSESRTGYYYNIRGRRMPIKKENIFRSFGVTQNTANTQQQQKPQTERTNEPKPRHKRDIPSTRGRVQANNTIDPSTMSGV